MTERRSTYFAYQGLLVSVLLLLFLYLYRGTEGWLPRFYILLMVSLASLLMLRVASAETLTNWVFQAGLFIGDAAIASLILSWTSPTSDFYLIYFLIIFGTALTRSTLQSMLITAATCLLFMMSVWSPGRGLPNDTGFWLRVLLLVTSSAFLTILARDSQAAQEEQARRYQGRLVEVERLATLGQIAGEVAHRIKGPLTTIMVNAEILTYRKGQNKEALRELKQIQEEVGHCKEILKSLLDLGRIEEVDLAPIDLREPIRFALRSIEPQTKKLGLKVKVSGLDAPLSVMADHSLLQEALSALLQNAVEASKRGGRVRLIVEKDPHFSLEPGGAPSAAYQVTVEDDGKGIAHGDLERIFQPFYTTKGAQGSGLGLSAALRILQKHNGTVEAYSAGPGQGARLRLRIPRGEVPKAV